MNALALTYLALAVVATAFALILYFTLTAEIKKWRNENLSLKLQIKELHSKLSASLPRSPFHGKRGKDKNERAGKYCRVVWAGSFTTDRRPDKVFMSLKTASEHTGIPVRKLSRIANTGRNSDCRVIDTIYFIGELEYKAGMAFEIQQHTKASTDDSDNHRDGPEIITLEDVDDN